MKIQFKRYFKFTLVVAFLMVFLLSSFYEVSEANPHNDFKRLYPIYSDSDMDVYIDVVSVKYYENNLLNQVRIEGDFWINTKNQNTRELLANEYGYKFLAKQPWMCLVARVDTREDRLNSMCVYGVYSSRSPYIQYPVFLDAYGFRQYLNNLDRGAYEYMSAMEAVRLIKELRDNGMRFDIL